MAGEKRKWAAGDPESGSGCDSDSESTIVLTDSDSADTDREDGEVTGSEEGCPVTAALEDALDGAWEGALQPALRAAPSQDSVLVLLMAAPDAEGDVVYGARFVPPSDAAHAALLGLVCVDYGRRCARGVDGEALPFEPACAALGRAGILPEIAKGFLPVAAAFEFAARFGVRHTVYAIADGEGLMAVRAARVRSLNAELVNRPARADGTVLLVMYADHQDAHAAVQYGAALVLPGEAGQARLRALGCVDSVLARACGADGEAMDYHHAAEELGGAPDGDAVEDMGMAFEAAARHGVGNTLYIITRV